VERLENLNSSVLASASYDEKLQLLTIAFKSGKTYDFFDVPPEIWNGFKEAESKGSFFSRNRWRKEAPPIP